MIHFRPRWTMASALAMAAGLLSHGIVAAGVTSSVDAGLETPPPDQQPNIPAHVLARMMGGAERPSNDLPKFDDIAKDFTKVVSTTDAEKPLYNLWIRERDGQVLAELPANYDSQLLFIAYTITGGIPTAGVQFGDLYAQWKRFDRRLALIQPNYAVRTTGDDESRRGRDRVFTDRVILDIPIAAEGPNGGIVVNMTDLLVGQSNIFFGRMMAGANRNLLKIATAKAFPQNVEVGFELPLGPQFGGRIGSIHYSIKSVPENPSYKPRKADNRVGYFTTAYRDIGDAGRDTPWVRYINRWHLEKADPKLRLSPPKQPIVFYLEHTIPVRYRRWVREGVLEWNKAFEKVGILNAIEVYQQDARTGAHMDKDPADARYNFVVWTNANMGFAIGPSRVDPRTGEILDADVVMDEGFITHWARAWRQLIPEMAMEGLGPETLAWLEQRPRWDPRVRLAAPAERDDVIRTIQHERANRGFHRFAGHPAASVDPTLMGTQPFDGLALGGGAGGGAGRISQVNGMCMHGMVRSLDVALFRLGADLIAELADENGEAANGDVEGPDADSLDGMPEWFVGPLLRDLTMHEIGHTLGLRHNFKSSSIYSLEQINSPEHRGKPFSGSVMDYNPLNINMPCDDGDPCGGAGSMQGDYSMATIGPYDYWAVAYGYSLEEDLSPILARVSEPELAYATDEDTWGPDPLARRWYLGSDPLDYAETQMRIVHHLRGKLLDRIVKEGESWAKARQGYEVLLGRHFGAVSVAAGWIGGSHVHRDHKGDPGARTPITTTDTEMQRRALRFVIDNAFREDAFGLTEELLKHMTVDKWWDDGGFWDIFQDNTWPVHDRILGLQAAALTMVLNPTRLNRVLDNEFRVEADRDYITLPEVLFGVSDAIWSEISAAPTRSYTARQPMISSLRRNLQAEHVKRLIDLSFPNDGFGAAARPVSNLSVFKLREIKGTIDGLLKNHAARLDPYTLAHLDESRVRIEKALDAQYIYNTDAFGTSMSLPFFFFQEEEQPQR